MRNTININIINWVKNNKNIKEINSKIWGEYFTYEYCDVYNYINDIHFCKGKKNRLNNSNDEFYKLFNKYIKTNKLPKHKMITFDNLFVFAKEFYKNNDLNFVKNQIKNCIILVDDYENENEYKIINKIFNQPEKYKVNIILADNIVSNIIYGWFAPDGVYTVGYYVDKENELYDSKDEIFIQIRPIYVLVKNRVNISIRIRLYFPSELLDK